MPATTWSCCLGMVIVATVVSKGEAALLQHHHRPHYSFPPREGNHMPHEAVKRVLAPFVRPVVQGVRPPSPTLPSANRQLLNDIVSGFQDFDDTLRFHDDDKRQYADYGHLRFGKRAEFGDYGHLRFGRSGGKTREGDIGDEYDEGEDDERDERTQDVESDAARALKTKKYQAAYTMETV